MKNERSLLRISTAGSVDDGKSTLIGRLLHDCHGIMEDQWQQLSSNGSKEIDLASLTDGLKSEREQGITIDVAYKFFSTPKRKFILADTPGHVQYTRNMATGASTADAAIILVDARQGPTEQTRRHAAISQLLRIPLIIFAINKMDLVDWSHARFREINDELRDLSKQLNLDVKEAIPVSALLGDNISRTSKHTPWYQGPTLLSLLEDLDTQKDLKEDGHLGVQYVIRPNQDFRGFAGRLGEGSLKVGDSVEIFPERGVSRIKSIWRGSDKISQATRGQSVTIELEDDRDCQAGSIISKKSSPLEESTFWESSLVWFDEAPAKKSQTYLLKHRSRYYRVVLDSVIHRLNLESLDPEASQNLKMNDVGKVLIKSQTNLAAERYHSSRLMGSFLLVDPDSFRTVAAGCFEKPISRNIHKSATVWHFIESIDKESLDRLKVETEAIFITEEDSTGAPQSDFWWLEQIADSSTPVITNKSEFLEFQNDKISWKVWTKEEFSQFRTKALVNIGR